MHRGSQRKKRKEEERKAEREGEKRNFFPSLSLPL
jgi:hypothetical protein